MSVSRHLLVVVLSALLPLLAVAVLLATLLVRAERHATEREMAESAYRLAHAVDAELDRSFAALQALSRSEALQRGDLKAFYTQAQDMRDALRLWDNLLLLSPQADHLLNLMHPYGTPLAPVAQPEGTLTAAATKSPYVSNVLRGRADTEWLVYIAYPAIHGGEVKYVIGGTMNYRYWTRWLNERTSPGMVAGIVDRDGVLLARTREPEKVVGQPVQPWYRELIAASPGGFSRGAGVTDSDVAVAFQRSSLSGWTVNVFTPGAVLDAPMRRTAVYVSLAVGIAVLIAVALSARRARFIEQAQRDGEAMLRQSEEKFRTIAHAAPAIVWTTDAQGITFINRRWPELTGQPIELALGQGYTEYVHPEDHQRLAPLRQRSRSTGVAYEGEIRYRCRDGHYRWHAFRALPAPDGDREHWYGCAVDVHDARDAQEALRDADRRKDEFLATLAHELRNPLAPIRNALYLLALRPSGDASVRAAQSMMERQVAHMVRLIDDLLDVSRITRGRLELRREPVELKRVVEQAVETSRPHITQRLTLVLPTEPVYLEADAVRLAQVLSNLLNNAAKFTPRDGEIRLTAACEGDEVAIRVRDTGIGIAAAELPQLFRMFSQAGPPIERAKGGLGIGLALARSLVELHGGTIQASSDGPGKGAEFTVRLKVLPMPDVSQVPAVAPRSYEGAVRRVLVVDDVPDNAQSLAALLRHDGNAVEIAFDGLQALDIAESFKPDLILLDLGLPNLDGVEVCRLIRSRPWGKGIVIAAVTGWGQEADRRQTADAGFDAHLVKPIDYDAVRALLASPLMA